MDLISKIISQNFVDQKYVAYKYENTKRGKFRDFIYFYRNGKIRFERFCYGEAAGIVFGVWANGINDQGEINYVKPLPSSARIEELPQRLSQTSSEDVLQFDDKNINWELYAQLKSDKANGYIGGFLGKLMGK